MGTCENPELTGACVSSMKGDGNCDESC